MERRISRPPNARPRLIRTGSAHHAVPPTPEPVTHEPETRHTPPPVEPPAEPPAPPPPPPVSTTPPPPPVPPPPPPDEPQTYTLEDHEQGVPMKWVLAVVGCLVAVCALGYYYLVDKPERTFKEAWVDIKITHNPPNAVSVDWSKEINSQTVRLISREGYGLRAIIATSENGKPVTKTEELVKPNSNPNPGLRAQEVDEARAKLTKTIAALNVPPNKVFMLYVDQTNGMTPELGKQVRDRYAALGVDELVKKGSGVKLLFYKLTSDYTTSAMSAGKTDIKASSEAGSYATEVNKGLDNLTEVHPKQPYSMIAPGLFNTLSEAKKAGLLNSDTAIVIITDGREHNPELGVMLESKHPVPTPEWVTENAPELRTKLQSIREAPDCNGAAVEFWLPDGTENRPLAMAIVEKIWIPILEKKGCQVGDKKLKF